MDEVGLSIGRAEGAPPLSYLHSDQAPSERAAVLARLRAEGGLLCLTDAAAPVSADGPPVAANVVINFELPLKRDGYARRVAGLTGVPPQALLQRSQPAAASPGCSPCFGSPQALPSASLGKRPPTLPLVESCFHMPV